MENEFSSEEPETLPKILVLKKKGTKKSNCCVKVKGRMTVLLVASRGEKKVLDAADMGKESRGAGDGGEEKGRGRGNGPQLSIKPRIYPVKRRVR